MSSVRRLLLVRLVLAATVFAPEPVRGQVRVALDPAEISGPTPSGALDHIVAVGRGRGYLVLAIPPPGGSGRWRFRSLLLRPMETEVESATLSRSGTKLLVELRDGDRKVPKVIDLARAVPGVALEGEEPSTHRVPDQVFALVKEGRLEPVDDRLRYPRGRPYSCGGDNGPVLQAMVHGDGTILYATEEGALRRCAPGAEEVELGYRLPSPVSSQSFYLVAGQTEGTRKFLVVVQDRPDRLHLIDPENAETLRTCADLYTALLRAHFILFGGGEVMTDRALSALVTELLRQSLSTEIARSREVRAGVRWSFFTVAPDPNIYAPILELAKEETVFPSDLSLWNDLEARLDVPFSRAAVGMDPPGLDEAYLRAYLRMREEGRARSALYYRVTSYPGSWLMEYWIYYPFDVGGVGPHLHDPEHLFVEVSKLGGTVSAIVASAHSSVTPNNVYLTSNRLGNPVSLPLFTIVELKKHASAPDVNGDGVFTPGLDENFYDERAKVWGVRDTLGGNDAHFPAYESAMAAPRFRQNWLALARACEYYPDVAPVDSCHSKLESLTKLEEDFPRLSPEGQMGARAILHHRDAVDRRAIFKKWLFPPSFWRVGLGTDRGARVPALAVSYVRDFSKWRLPAIPGRLSLDFSYAPRGQGDSEDEAGDEGGTAFDVGARYERLLSNLFGYYAGLHLRHIDREDVGFQKGVWLSVGPMFEISLLRSNFLFQAGYAFKGGESPRFEWRVALGCYQGDRWHWGIPEKQTSPY